MNAGRIALTAEIIAFATSVGFMVFLSCCVVVVIDLYNGDNSLQRGNAQ
jgi:hypothetical protein